MPSTDVLRTLSGISSIFGLLATLAYLFVFVEAKRAERSIRTTIDDTQAIFNADQIVRILADFKTDEARLQALQHFADWDRHKAEGFLAKVKGGVTVTQLDSLARRDNLSRLFIIGLFLLAFGLIGLSATRRKPESTGVQSTGTSVTPPGLVAPTGTPATTGTSGASGPTGRNPQPVAPQPELPVIVKEPAETGNHKPANTHNDEFVVKVGSAYPFESRIGYSIGVTSIDPKTYTAYVRINGRTASMQPGQQIDTDVESTRYIITLVKVSNGSCTFKLRTKSIS